MSIRQLRSLYVTNVTRYVPERHAYVGFCRYGAILGTTKSVTVGPIWTVVVLLGLSMLRHTYLCKGLSRLLSGLCMVDSHQPISTPGSSAGRISTQHLERCVSSAARRESVRRRRVHLIGPSLTYWEGNKHQQPLW